MNSRNRLAAARQFQVALIRDPQAQNRHAVVATVRSDRQPRDGVSPWRRPDIRAFWLVVGLFYLGTRLMPAVEYFSIDNVNLALALERFDPREHRPQPPGYPLFVLLGRSVDHFVQDPARTFHWISIVVGAACLPLIFGLARRLFSLWVAKAATLLLAVNPVFWHAGLEGPLRPHLALFSLIAASCAWRAWKGDARFIPWGALAIGLGSGFRPEVLVYALPMWLGSAVRPAGDRRFLLIGSAVLTASVGAWLVPLVLAAGGLDSFWNLMVEYGVEQAGTGSALFGSGLVAWLKQINRLFIWNAIAVAGAVWALPWCFRRFGRSRHPDSAAGFIALWIGPGLAVQAITHVAAPGHTLFTTPALSIIASVVLAVGTAELTRSVRNWRAIRETALLAAALTSVLLFLNALPMPREPATGPFTMVRNAVSYGIYETSLGSLRWFDEITRQSLKEISVFTPGTGEPAIIVSSDSAERTWFLNWRIARYYLPDREIWALSGQSHKTALLVRRDRVIETRSGIRATIPIPCHGRILWLIENGGSFYLELSRIWEMSGSPHVVVTATEVGSRCPAFSVGGFDFVPQEVQTGPQRRAKASSTKGLRAAPRASPGGEDERTQKMNLSPS